MYKNIIITGGSGQDGQILVKILKKNKNKIFIFSNKGPFQKKKQNFSFVKENLLNKKRLDFFFKKNKPDIVLHLAAKNPNFFEKKKRFFRENFLATKNIFLSTFHANKNAKFIFCSSSKIFKKKTGFVNEKSKKIISCDYTKFRVKSDNFMLKYKKKYKINYTNAILFNHDSKFRNKKFLFPRLIKFIKNKDNINLKKIIKANIVSDFSHAEDICYGLKKLIFSNLNHNSIILSSGKSTSVNKILDYILTKHNLKFDLKINKNINKKSLIGNNDLAKKTLNWKQKKNIFLAVDEIYNSY